MSEENLARSSEIERIGSSEERDSLTNWLLPDAPTEVKQRVQELDAIGPRTILASYEGPLPPASQFATYEEAVPGAGERILQMAEKEQDLREQALRSQYRSGRMRNLSATAISVLALGVAALGHYFGSPWPAVPIGLAGFFGLILKALKTSSGDQD